VITGWCKVSDGLQKFRCDIIHSNLKKLTLFPQGLSTCLFFLRYKNSDSSTERRVEWTLELQFFSVGRSPTCFRTLFWSRFWHHSYAQRLFTNRSGWSWHHITTWTRLQIGYVARAGELFRAGGFRNKRNLGRDIGLFFLEQFGYHGMGDQNQHVIHHISCILQIMFHERYERHVTIFFWIEIDGNPSMWFI